MTLAIMDIDSYSCFFRLHLFYLIFIPTCITSCSKTAGKKNHEDLNKFLLMGPGLINQPMFSELIKEINIIPLVQEEGNFIDEVEKVSLAEMTGNYEQLSSFNCSTKRWQAIGLGTGFQKVHQQKIHYGYQN